MAALLALSGAVLVSPAYALPPPQGGYGSYSKEYQINGIPKYGAADIMPELQRNFDGYFTFAGCGKSIRVGQVCRLAGGTSPVEVIAVEEYGFSLKSLPGHPEGADRFINFQFRTNDVPGNATLKSLKVDAWGPVSGASLAGPLNSETLANGAWQTFANNINSKFPKEPAGAGGAV
ncbi:MULTISPECIES: hypothetical protein [unclassified Pseudonocardia]|uniref:hypothetical protein n=1 Tax=unclassified Pseudonocardia TaxID=2619320 RepID=UPI00111510B3|nr:MULTISPECIES: hypothetical protein [unclassified Pseudonocardia]